MTILWMPSSLLLVAFSQRCWALPSILTILLLMTSCLQQLSAPPELLLLPAYFSDLFLLLFVLMSL